MSLQVGIVEAFIGVTVIDKVLRQPVKIVDTLFLCYSYCAYSLQSIHEPSYALNKTHSEAIIKLPYVSALGCHHQGVIKNKGVTP